MLNLYRYGTFLTILRFRYLDLHMAACLCLQEHKARVEAQAGREAGGRRHQGDEQEAGRRQEDQQEREGREDPLEEE